MVNLGSGPVACAMALTVLLLGGCDDSAPAELPSPDATAAVSFDAAVDADAMPDGSVAALAPFPGGCETDQDCDSPLVCLMGICVRPPPPRPSEYSCDDAPVPGSTPDFSCWQTPPELADGPAMVTGQGLLEYFGEGGPTIGLRVRFYDFETFDPTPCLGAGERERDVRAARVAVELCLDETLDGQANTAPIADVQTEACATPQAESGCWTAPNLPTGRALVARITGDPTLWVPTYQYGLFINPCTNGQARFDSGICPEQLVDAVSDVDWSCDLVDAASPFQGTSAEPYWFKNLSVISQETWDSFPQTAGEVRINLGRGAIAGRQYDCSGRSVVNATFALANPGPRDTYFNGIAADTLPSPGRSTTNLLGTYANLNTPPGGNALVAAAWQGETLMLVNYERFFLLPDTVTIVNPTGRGPVRVEPPY